MFHLEFKVFVGPGSILGEERVAEQDLFPYVLFYWAPGSHFTSWASVAFS
jgi:hypothetical protein